MSESMFYQSIGNSIQANKDKIEKLEKQNARLKKQKKVLQQENKQLKEQVQDLKADYGTIAQIERDLYKEVIEEVRKVIRDSYVEVLKYHDEPSETTSYEIVTVELLQILDKAMDN